MSRENRFPSKASLPNSNVTECVNRGRGGAKAGKSAASNIRSKRAKDPRETKGQKETKKRPKRSDKTKEKLEREKDEEIRAKYPKLDNIVFTTKDTSQYDNRQVLDSFLAVVSAHSEAHCSYLEVRIRK